MSLDVQPASGVPLRQLEALYRTHPHPPFGYYPDLAREDIVRYAARSAHRLLARDDVVTFALGGDEPSGWAAYQPLAWDSEQLGVSAGRIAFLELDCARFPNAAARLDAARSLVDAALAAARREPARTEAKGGAEHVSARVHAADIVFAQALESAGFELVDGLVRFGFDRERSEIPAWGVPGLALRESRATDLEQLRELARSGFVYDRFHNDPVLREGAADALCGEWAANAVRGGTGCGVLVAELEGQVVGFFILAEDMLARDVFGAGVGTLVLITVDAKYRRRGIANALSLGSVEWLTARGNRFCEVGTQIANIPASSVYLEAGFRMIETSLSLRWWQPAG